jgi:plastocyanin
MKCGFLIATSRLGLALFLPLVTGCMQGTEMEKSHELAMVEAKSDKSVSKSQFRSALQNQAAAPEIVIDNFTFDPPQLTINTGTKVTWVNHDDVPHTATSTVKPRVFDSGTLDTDQKFSFVFTAPGTYDYFCAVHPKMTAQVIVK